VRSARDASRRYARRPYGQRRALSCVRVWPGSRANGNGSREPVQRDLMNETRAFRFMVTVRNAPDARAWREKATRLEALGYDQLNIPDHLAAAFAVVPALTVAAAATTRLRVSG